MRVAFVLGGFPRLSETFILDQMVGLLERGHELTILARLPSDPWPQSAVSGLLERVRYWERNPLPRTLRLLRSHPARTLGDLARVLLRGELRAWARVTTLREIPRPDVLYAHFGPQGIVAEQTRALCALPVPLVTAFHGYDLSSLPRQRKPGLYARLFARGQLMLPVSQHFRDRLLELGCPLEKARVHRMGVDPRQFRFRERAPAQPLRLLSVGRLVEKKGFDTGLRGFARFRGQAPEARWTVVGDGPMRPELEALRRELGLEEQVELLGAAPREAVERLLQESHLFLAPSQTAADGDQEGIPVSIMEAMACGLPVISTRHSGIPELVRDGETGLLVGERDPPALAEALARMARAPERWAAMGRAGRSVVEREYDLPSLNQSLEQLLLEVAGS